MFSRYAYCLSRFTHCVETAQGACIFNAANLERVYGNSALARVYDRLRKPGARDINVLGDDLAKSMIEKSLLVNSPECDGRLVDTIRERALAALRVDNVFIYLTEACNFDCAYCYVRRNRVRRNGGASMTCEIAHQVTRFVGTLIEAYSLTRLFVIFYGGEPLLNWEILQIVVERMEELQRLLGCDIHFRLITNGSLLREHHIAFLRRHSIVPTISIDGSRDVSASARRRPDTWGDAEYSAAALLKISGMPYELSVTVSSQNVRSLPEELRHILSTLSPISVRINVPEAYDGVEREEFLRTCSALGDTWIAAFEVLHEYGVEATNLGLDSFRNRQPQYFPCSGSGRRLAISPRGEVGPCESFLTKGEHLLGSVWDHPNGLCGEERRRWTGRTGYLIPECQDCIALGLCGGGCAYNAEALSRSFLSHDESICAVARSTIRAFLAKGISLSSEVLSNQASESIVQERKQNR